MTAIEFNNISKQYRLGLVSTNTLSHDLKRWYAMNIQGKDDPYLKIGEVNDRKINAAAMAEELVKRGLRIISGRTESHVFLVDLRSKNITGKAAEEALGKAHITVNKNAIPNDPEKPFVTSGIRIGTAAMTTRGFDEADARALANLVADVLENPADEATLARTAEAATALCTKNPVYGA